MCALELVCNLAALREPAAHLLAQARHGHGELVAATRCVGDPEGQGGRLAAGIFHATDDGAETVKEIVAALAEHAPTEPSVRHVPLPEARKKMGPYAEALALDQIVLSPRARALGWAPTLHSVTGNAARLFEEWKRGKAA